MTGQMKNIFRIAVAVALAAALAAAPETCYAQSRGGGGHASSSVSRGGGGGSVSRSSSAGHSSMSASRPSASVSRPSGSAQNRSTVSRSSASTQSRSSASRSSGNVSRPSAQTRPSASSQNRSTASRSSANTQSRSNTTASRSGSQSRTVTPARPGGSVSRSAGTPTARPSTDGRPSRSVTPARPSGAEGGPQAGERVGSRGNMRGGQPGPGGDRHDPNGHRIPPRERGFIEHHHATMFYHRGPHYFGYRVHVLPTHYIRRTFWGYDYYICDGIYYRYWDNCYYICRPPFGILFDRALYDLELVLCDFAYYNTVRRTYNVVNDNYRTIAEQNDIIAENNATIAAQNSAIARGAAAANVSYDLASRLGLFQSYANADQQYYYDDGIFFIEKDGQYQTIVPPAGALIAELPDDYDIITLDGEEFYKVDDTVYRTVVVDGKALFEVLGQLQK